MDERDIVRVLKARYSAGTETFRDTLLDRCLGVLGDDGNGTDLEDEELEMLAAAGDSHALKPVELVPVSND